MIKSSLIQRFPSFRSILVISTVLRIALILYSEWHDRHSVVKYTDVDYRVFSDAAHFILHSGPGETNQAQGPIVQFLKPYNITLTVGDPYTRETYRYTPLLALLLTPNGWLHLSFGKYLFALCDIINGVLIYRLLLSEILPHTLTTRTLNKVKEDPTVPNIKAFHDVSAETKILATLYSSIHLLNPLVFSISTRGSSESILSLFILLTLYAALKNKWDAAAIMLGLSAHWKIYPVIYGVACLGVIGDGQGTKTVDNNRWRRYIAGLINHKTVRFATISAGNFILLGGGCYLVWGYPFLYETYLYHAHRLDHRHNFSPYFYLTYLTYPPLAPSSSTLPSSQWSKIIRSPLVSFIPQMSLALGTGFLFGRRKQDLVFAWFVQTVVFVLFNKVCTSQYFLWYLLLLPLLLPRLSTSMQKGLVYLGVWIGTQALWLGEAYKLEFLGRNVFFGLWLRSLVYVLGNVWVLAGIMSEYAVR